MAVNYENMHYPDPDSSGLYRRENSGFLCFQRVSYLVSAAQLEIQSQSCHRYLCR